MIRAVVAAVAVLMISAAAAFAFQARAAVQVAIDMNTSGNTAASLGAADACASAAIGDTFDIDIVIKGVPPVREDHFALGLAGFGYNLTFDPAVVNVVAVDNDFMLNAAAPFERIVANYDPDGASNPPNPLPAISGNLRVDYLDISEDYENGDGVLSRLTLKAVGAGTTTLRLNSDPEDEPAPITFMAGGFAYGISQMTDGLVTVGAPCDPAILPTPFDPPDKFEEDSGIPSSTATPGPDSSPTPTPTLGPDAVDQGEASVSLDAITGGNSATKIDEIDDCGQADTGDTFTVDLVIQKVDDLLGWEAPVSYDPGVLKIVDRDVKLFLASSSGSQVFDASNQTPNLTGFYRSAAVDQADPAAPESGDGVLMRLTMKALRQGTSRVSVLPVDLNEDGETETGVLLRNTDNEAIGGTIFRGPTNDTEIRVGSACPGGQRVSLVAGQASGDSDNGETTEGDGDSNTWIFIVAAAAAAVLAAGTGAALLLRRRRGSGGGTAA